jgi:tripartite-type tricarboxylate transporter receptor subunit TctC
MMTRNFRTFPFLATACAALLMAWTSAEAQDDFPTKPITLIIPTAAGGSHDLTARAVTSVAEKYLGQPMIVELKPGGGGAIGTEQVFQAAPDGYTLLMGGPNWNTTLPAVEGRSHGPDDLAAVCRINFSPVMVAARLDAPYKTFKDMIEWAKANPGKLVFGHTGPWSQSDLTWKQISKIAGLQTKNVPYEGGGPSTTALIGGHIDVAINPTNPTTTFVSAIQAKQILPLAVLAAERDPTFPDVPTAREEGIDVTYDLWRGFLAPKDTPAPIIQKLSDACKQMVEDPDVVAMIEKLGDRPNYLSAQDFTPVWQKEFVLHKELGAALK